MQREEKFSKAKKSLIVIVTLLLAFTVLYWGLGTGWGNTSFHRISIAGDSGDILSAIEIIPKGVSKENPAPVVITNHGAGSQGGTELSYGIELSRRGYIVILCDLSGAGESTMNTSVTTAEIMKFWVDYAEEQDFISEIGITGLSAAGSGLGQILNDGYMDKLNCAMNIISSRSFPNYPTERTCNLLCLWSDTDQNDFGSPGVTYIDGYDPRLDMIKEYTGDANAEYDKLYGRYEDGNAFYSTVYHGTHPLSYLNNECLTKLCDFVENSMPTNTTLLSNNHVSGLFYMVGYLCCILLVVMCTQLAYTLTLCPLFYESITTEKAMYRPISVKQRAFNNICLDLIVPFILMRYVGAAIGNATWLKPVFRSTYINPIIFWLASVGVFSLIVLLIRKKQAGKKMTAEDLGTGATGEEAVFHLSRVKAGIIIACLTALAAFVWIDCVVETIGFHYSASSLGNMTRLTPDRFIRAIPYVIVILFIVAMININIATTRRFADTGHETLDLVRDIVYNIMLSITPLTVVILLTIGWSLWSGTGWGLLSIANFRSVITVGLGFPLMMGSSAGISTYLYRKTGNIYTGVFTATFILAFFTVAFAIMAA